MRPDGPDTEAVPTTPKRIRRSYLQFFQPGEHSGQDFIDNWHFSIDDKDTPSPPAPESSTVVIPVAPPATATATATMPMPAPRAALEAAPVRRLELAPAPTVRISRDELVEMRKTLMQSANAIDRALEMLDAVLEVRRSA